jgi:hypothetical protein
MWGAGISSAGAAAADIRRLPRPLDQKISSNACKAKGKTLVRIANCDIQFNEAVHMVNVVLEVVLAPRQELHVVARDRPSAAVACDVRRRHFSVVRRLELEHKVMAPVPTRRCTGLRQLA